jgi:hypothetical protein
MKSLDEALARIADLEETLLETKARERYYGYEAEMALPNGYTSGPWKDLPEAKREMWREQARSLLERAGLL